MFDSISLAALLSFRHNACNEYLEDFDYGYADRAQLA